MKIIQITATSAWSDSMRDVHERIYGLGDDQNMYVWDIDSGEWLPNWVTLKGCQCLEN